MTLAANCTFSLNHPYFWCSSYYHHHLGHYCAHPFESSGRVCCFHWLERFEFVWYLSLLIRNCLTRPVNGWIWLQFWTNALHRCNRLLNTNFNFLIYRLTNNYTPISSSFKFQHETLFVSQILLYYLSVFLSLSVSSFSHLNNKKNKLPPQTK